MIAAALALVAAIEVGADAIPSTQRRATTRAVLTCVGFVAIAFAVHGASAVPLHVVAAIFILVLHAGTHRLGGEGTLRAFVAPIVRIAASAAAIARVAEPAHHALDAGWSDAFTAIATVLIAIGPGTAFVRAVLTHAHVAARLSGPVAATPGPSEPAPMTQDAAPPSDDASTDGDPASGDDEASTLLAGRWIGAFERGIVAVLVLHGAWSAVAFVFTAKSIARYRQLEQQRAAEYYLLGTLASVGWAIAVATGLPALIAMASS